MLEEEMIGIDLGTTNSCVGVIDTGFPVLIPDGEGNRLTPSVVSFEGGRVRRVGREARRESVEAGKAERTIYSVKRLMGRRYAELSAEEIGDLAYRVVEGEAGWACVLLEGQAVLPEQVSAHVLKKLKADAERYLGREVKRAVISIPAYFNEAQRQKTRQAAELAGLVVERMISEPTAAALAYGMDREHERAKIAVYDMGGGTFDVSILDLTRGVFEVLATHGDTRLGGDDIDQVLVDWLKSQVEADSGEGALTGAAGGAPEQESCLHAAAEKAKLALSQSDSVEIAIPEMNWCGSLSRGELNRLARPVVERTRAACLRAMQDAGIQGGELEAVLLVGGQTRMPLVREVVEEIFGKRPDSSIDPDEAVARGATVQAGMLSGALRELVLLDVTPLSLGIETFGGLMNVIIPRNSTIPCKAGEIFTTAVDFQEKMRVSILQGERELASDNWKLGEMEIAFAKGLRGAARVGVQFEIDSDGLLHVLARDLGSGEEKVIEVNSAVNVDDEKVEEMVSASVDHAFEDMEERRRIEARAKAQRLIETTRRAMTMMGDALPGEIRDSIEETIRALEALEGRGSSREWKARMQELDLESLPLADLLMERAMEKAAAGAMGSVSEDVE